MISVIIPTYNHAATLEACLQSALSQKGVEHEVIVVDDGSTDHTQSVLLPFADRVQIVEQRNAGSNPARTTGFDYSVGDYLLFLDADAILPEGFLATMEHHLDQRPEAGWAYCDFYFGWKKFSTGPFDPEKLKRMSYIHTSALIRRNHFPGFDPAIKRFQDWDLWLTMIERGSTGTFVPNVALRFQKERSGAPISSWMPKAFYKAPLRWLPGVSRRVKAYNTAKDTIMKKHKLL